MKPNAPGVIALPSQSRRRKDWRRQRSESEAALIRLEPGELDHACPFVGFLGDELGEIGHRAWERLAAEVGHARLDGGIGERRVHLAIEPLDDLGWRAPGNADAEPP